MSVVGCLSLCISTAAVSDGGDLNYDLYYIGSRLYWLFALIMIAQSSFICTELWQFNHFIADWSVKVKSVTGYVSYVFIVVYVLQYFGVLKLGNYPEWIISYFIVFYVFTLYWDLKNMDILLRRK